MFVWIPGSILNFRIGSVLSIGGLIAATLFAATISDSQIQAMLESLRFRFFFFLLPCHFHPPRMSPVFAHFLSAEQTLEVLMSGSSFRASIKCPVLITNSDAV